MREENERRNGVKYATIFKNKVRYICRRLLNTRDEVSAIFDIGMETFNNNF